MPTERQYKIVEGYLMGMDNAQIAKYAGYANKKSVSDALGRDKWVKAEIAKHERQIQKQALVTRDSVQKIVLEAVDIARLKAEPGDMIRGAAELNKMNGFYAPEKKELAVEGKVRHVVSELETLSDTELMAALEIQPDPIEAEFEVIRD